MFDNDEILPGEYLHYKGRKYEVLCMATHSETEERLVVYRPLYGDAFEQGERLGDVWVRPAAMFVEQVEVDGSRIPRFKKL